MGPIDWYFHLNLNREYIKTAKNGGFCDEFLHDFQTVLAIFCCYNYGANASEPVQKIASDQKEYHKLCSCVIICLIAKIYLSVNNSEKRLVTRSPPT